MGMYATDADLLARDAAAALATPDQRTVALLDAEQEIDVRVYGDMALQAHVLLTMHKLGERGFAGPSGTATGVVTSRKAGAIGTTYAHGTYADGPHASTRWGRAFDAIPVLATPLTDCPAPGSWP